MVTVLLGTLVGATLWGLVEFTRRRQIGLQWWEWTLVGAALSYGGVVLAAVLTLLGEGTPRAALVIGTLIGVPAVIFGVLLGRFVFGPKLAPPPPPPPPLPAGDTAET